jgi:hypothetical protein
MAISHNREIQSSSTTASNFVPTCESIDQLTCPSPDEGKHAQRHIAIGCRMPVAGRVRQRSCCRLKGWPTRRTHLRVQRNREISVLDVSSKPRHNRKEGAPNRRHSRSRSRTRPRIHRGQIQIGRNVGRQIRGQGGRTRSQNGQCHRGPPRIRDQSHLRQSREHPRQDCRDHARTPP